MNQSIIKSKKYATMLGYLSIVLSTVANFILTRIYLKQLGQDGYGLYQMIYSIAQYILILDMGISTVMVRNLVDYRNRGDEKGAENFAYHMFLILLAVMTIIIIVCIVLNASIESIYTKLSPAEYELSHKMFWIMTGSLSLTIVEHFLKGIINSKEYFTVTNIFGIATTVIKFIAVTLLLNLGVGVISVATADLVTKAVVVSCAVYIAFAKIKFVIKKHYFDKAILAATATFMVAMLLQSLSTFANNAIDKTILGIMMTKADVAVYAIAMTFISVFNMMPTIFTNMFLPEAIRIKNSGQTAEAYTRLIIRVGRYQFAICGLLLLGFLLCGRDFIALMYGKESIKAWIIALIIMIPGLISLSEAAINGVIDANDKRMLFSKMVLGMSALNIVLTIIMVKSIGIMGAPISTAISYFAYYIFARNIVAKRLFNINLWQMIREIPQRTVLCLLIAAIPGIILNNLYPEQYTILLFVCKAIVIILAYTVSMLIFGFSAEEKKSVLRIIRIRNLNT